MNDRTQDPAEDGSNDGVYQREALAILDTILQVSPFAGGILLAITPENRIVPVMLLPDYPDPPAAAAQILRQALAYVEAGRLRAEPKPMPTPPMNG